MKKKRICVSNYLKADLTGLQKTIMSERHERDKLLNDIAKTHGLLAMIEEF